MPGVLPTQLPDFNYRPMQPQGMGVLRPPAPNPPPPNLPPFSPAGANPQQRQMTLEEMVVGVPFPDVVQILEREMGPFESLSPEDKERWWRIFMAAPVKERPIAETPPQGVLGNLGGQNRERARQLGLIP